MMLPNYKDQMDKMPLEKQPCIRIDPLFGAFMSGDSDPAARSIGYLKE